MKRFLSKAWNSKVAWFLVPNDIALALWVMILFWAGVAFGISQIARLLTHNDFIFKLYELIVESYT